MGELGFEGGGKFDSNNTTFGQFSDRILVRLIPFLARASSLRQG